jgi:hypothetical protein
MLRAGGRHWLHLAEGDPYAFLDTIRVDEREVPAVALAACGWAVSLDDGPRRRARVRSLVVVTPDRRQSSTLERRDTGVVVMEGRGDGPMLRALASVWTAGAVA